MKRKSVKTMFSLLLSLIIIFTVFTSGYAYETWHLGFNPPYPISFSCWSGLADQTHWSIDYAATEWDNAGAGCLLWRSNTDHNNTTFPLKNGKNEITKGNRGTGMNSYLMCASRTVTEIDGHVSEVDIDINGSFPWINDGRPGCYDVQNCMTHELGHMLGLGDLYNSVYESEYTMYGHAVTGETKKRDLAQDDKNGVNYLY